MPLVAGSIHSGGDVLVVWVLLVDAHEPLAHVGEQLAEKVGALPLAVLERVRVVWRQPDTPNRVAGVRVHKCRARRRE